MRAVATSAVALLSAAACCVATPVPADAASVSMSGGAVVFRADAGEANRLVVRDLGKGQVRLQDAGAPISPATGCASPFPGAVDCTPARQGKRVRVSLGDGSDQLLVVGFQGVAVSAGRGHDAIVGGRGSDVLKGEGGEDVLSGSGGRDRLLGGAKNDLLLGRNGSDTLDGGAGNDQLGGGRGKDRLIGGPGIDRVNSGRDGGIDRVNCGKGKDFALLRPSDRSRGCEFERRVARVEIRR